MYPARVSNAATELTLQVRANASVETFMIVVVFSFIKD